MEGLEATKLWKGGCFQLISNVFCLTKWEQESPAKRMGGCFQLISKNNEVAGMEVSQTSAEIQPHEVWKLLNCCLINDNKFTNETGLVAGIKSTILLLNCLINLQ